MNNSNTPKLRPINHVAFVIDESGSMKGYRDAVPRVFDEQVKALATQSVLLEQETRVSLYLFNGLHGVRCIAYDCDVLRLPTLRDRYNPDGGTPLVSATLQAWLELEQTPELHADHSFLVFDVTDGEETERNSHKNHLLRERFNHQKENWTVCALVPDQKGRRFCGALGFADGNIQEWDATTEAGLKKASADITQATTNYMTLRSQGKRSSKNLFTPTQVGNRTTVVKALKPVTNPFTVFKAKGSGREQIAAFVERATRQPYVTGSAYYELVKPETIQSHKLICLRTKPDGHLYSGSLDQVRGVLGLPAGAEIKVGPAELKDFQVFIQSTSVNRHVIPEQEILVVKL